MILYKLWIKLLLKIKKFDWFIWSVSWTLKRNVSDWIDDVWFAFFRECRYESEIKCGIAIANVTFCITNTPTTLNVGDYDNTQIKYIIFQSTVSYQTLQHIPKKSIGNIPYILNLFNLPYKN